ncbi:hypothetical protein [Limnochorda pilosa]|uniref:Uncharacterized protein n=1 Tax=Limnochorda pilosa TaxID=1555112 RepID=A0A0K2SQK2_LIMPI|nr:hypothetical protein [Limnochorda pilosa]BAS29381.1 hypothetical protein LIP_3570 [Limnochorda pilosa]
MPKKVTLYVRDGDGQLWERAKALAGGDDSLSGLVTEALRRYVDEQERKQAARQEVKDRMREYVLETTIISGGVVTGSKRKVRFVGALLAEGQEATTIHDVFLTSGGKLVHFIEASDGNFYDVYETLDDLAARAAVPEDVLAEAVEALGEEYVVNID